MLVNDLDQGPDDPVDASSVVPERCNYEPPHMKRVGNLRRLVAGGAGSVAEVSDFLQKNAGQGG